MTTKRHNDQDNNIYSRERETSATAGGSRGTTKLIISCKKWGFIIINVALMIYLLETFGSKGFLGYMIIVLFIAVKKAWMFRENIVYQIEALETVIFGKPLGKSFWKKKEMKNTKVMITCGNKILWGKKYASRYEQTDRSKVSE